MAHLPLRPGCPQCGGPVVFPEGAAYARCEYCGAESFVDLSGVLLHQVIKPTIGHARVPGLLKARALESGWPEAKILALRLVYEPVWEIECPDGRRLRISAQAGSEGRFNLVELPGGERELVEPEERDGGSEWLEPELAPDSLAEVAARATGGPVAVKTVRLVHHPLYRGRLRAGGETREFRVDAVGGEVLDRDWPPHSTYRNRTRALLATGGMVAAATFLPLPAAAIVVTVLAGLAARLFWQRGVIPTPAVD